MIIDTKKYTKEQLKFAAGLFVATSVVEQEIEKVFTRYTDIDANSYTIGRQYAEGRTKPKHDIAPIIQNAMIERLIDTLNSMKTGKVQ